MDPETLDLYWKAVHAAELAYAAYYRLADHTRTAGDYEAAATGHAAYKGLISAIGDAAPDGGLSCGRRPEWAERPKLGGSWDIA